MDYRNPERRPDGKINVEIEHPEFGWVPFTANPDDTEELGRTLHAQILADEAAGSVSVAAEPSPPEAGPPPLSPAQFEYLLSTSGLDEVWQSVMGAAKSNGQRQFYAKLSAQLKRSSFLLETTLALKSHPMVQTIVQEQFPDLDLSDERIQTLWDEAANVDLNSFA